MRTPAILLAAAPLLTAALLAGACDGPCAVRVPCPSGGGWVYLPDNPSASLSAVTVDPPCLLTVSSPGDGRYIGVEIPGAPTASCTVHATLADGTQLSATLSFTPIMCCGSSSAAPQMLAPVGGTSPDAASD